MQELTYKIDLYEGPLELLLTLVNKSKMDIADIPIAVICSQYMEYIEQAHRMDMNLAAEFLVMASELMLIKSKMLLPKIKEEEEDPRAALAEALLRYQCAKEAAVLLAPMYDKYSGRMAKDTDEIKPDNELPTGLDPAKLAYTMKLLLSRMKVNETTQENHIAPLVKTHVVPVSEMLEKIITILNKRRTEALLSVLLNCAESRSALVAAFMALLELIKERKVLIFDQSGTDEFENLDNIRLQLNDEVRSA